MISFRLSLDPANSSLQILLSEKQIITNSGRNCSEENIYIELQFKEHRNPAPLLKNCFCGH